MQLGNENMKLSVFEVERIFCVLCSFKHSNDVVINFNNFPLQF